MSKHEIIHQMHQKINHLSNLMKKAASDMSSPTCKPDDKKHKVLQETEENMNTLITIFQTIIEQIEFNNHRVEIKENMALFLDGVCIAQKNINQQTFYLYPVLLHSNYCETKERYVQQKITSDIVFLSGLDNQLQCLIDLFNQETVDIDSIKSKLNDVRVNAQVEAYKHHSFCNQLILQYRQEMNDIISNLLFQKETFLSSEYLNNIKVLLDSHHEKEMKKYNSSNNPIDEKDLKDKSLYQPSLLKKKDKQILDLIRNHDSIVQLFNDLSKKIYCLLDYLNLPSGTVTLIQKGENQEPILLFDQMRVHIFESTTYTPSKQHEAYAHLRCNDSGEMLYYKYQKYEYNNKNILMLLALLKKNYSKYKDEIEKFSLQDNLDFLLNLLYEISNFQEQCFAGPNFSDVLKGVLKTITL
ncbi:hypothetical protein AB837_00609 [bacterium AB1]|nr:hypothetical protein AB837_00609 [bacterium AB1]